MKYLAPMTILAAVLGGWAATGVAAGPPEAASPEQAIEQLKTYDYGRNDQPLHVVELHVGRFATDPARRAEVAGQLAAVLAGPKTPYAAKVFICQQLLVVGTEAQVPLLARMLDDPQTAEIARYTLEGIPGEASLAALRGAAARLTGPPLVGAINSLGIRRDEKSVARLAGLLGNPDPLVAAAAAESLGKIGSVEAAAALAKAEAPGSVPSALHNAQLQCAEHRAAAGDAAGAAAIYQQVWASSRPAPWRLAGLLGLAKVAKDKATPAVLEAIASPDPLVQATAVRAGNTLPGPQITAALVERLDKLDTAGQVLILGVLAERADRAAAEAVTRRMTDKDEAVRAAAVRAMARLGDVSIVERLAALAAAPGAVQQAARESLVGLAGAGVEAKLLALAAAGEPGVRIEMLRALAARRAPGADAALLKAAADTDPQVRAAAWQSLALAAVRESYAPMVRLLAALPPGADAEAAERAVLLAGNRLEDAPARVGPLVAALPGAAAHARPSLLRVLGGFGGPQALAAVRPRLGDADPAVREAALRAVANWPDLSAAEDLLQIARASRETAQRAMALRGYLRLAGQVKDAAERLKLLEQVRPIARTLDAKRMLLACLAEAADPGALHVATALLDDAEVRAEAEVATLGIARALVRVDAPAVRAAMKKLAEISKNSGVAEQAAALDEEAAKAPSPGSAERALQADKQRSDAHKTALAKRAPKGYRLACYLDCGPDSSDGVAGGPQLRLVTGVPYFWPDSDRVADVRFGSVFYDSRQVVFEASGLSPKKHYQVGFTWWDFDHGTRSQSVWLTSGKGGRPTRLLDKTKLPAATDRQAPDGKTLPIPPELAAEGALQIAFRNESQPNAVLSEIWLWESDSATIERK
ncbi:MAG: HEAT repeat domain-containing protein [Thermoguttaceae bacterium]|jgi:HEAT repeat protein